MVKLLWSLSNSVWVKIWSRTWEKTTLLLWNLRLNNWSELTFQPPGININGEVESCYPPIIVQLEQTLQSSILKMGTNTPVCLSTDMWSQTSMWNWRGVSVKTAPQCSEPSASPDNAFMGFEVPLKNNGNCRWHPIQDTTPGGNQNCCLVYTHKLTVA